MNETNHSNHDHDQQRISALVDGELPDRRDSDAVFDRMLANDGARCRESRQRWQRYHLIGCVLRGEVERTGNDLCARIRARLDDEPTVLAPMRKTSRPPRIGRWQLGGALALAASLALVAVIAWQPSDDSATGDGIAQVAPPAPAEARFAQEVGEMLAQHGEFASSPGLSGLVVYAKLVSDAPIDR